MMVDAAYEDLYQALRPGIRENELVGIAAKKLYDHGSEDAESVNAIAGPRRCSSPASPRSQLLNDFGRLNEDGRRNGQAESPGGLQVDDQVRLGGLLHR